MTEEEMKSASEEVEKAKQENIDDNNVRPYRQTILGIQHKTKDILKPFLENDNMCWMLDFVFIVVYYHWSHDFRILRRLTALGSGVLSNQRI